MLWFRQWTSLTLYLTAFAIALAGVCILPFLRDWRVRAPLATFFLLGFTADQIMLALSGHHMTFELAAMVVRERALAGGFLRTFGDTIGTKALVVACVAVAFMLPPGRAWSVPSRNCAIPLGALVFAIALLANSRGQMDALPSPYSVPAQLLVSQLSSASADDGRRSSVNYAGTPRPTIKKIVMVVDESVRGDYLGLNNLKYDNTPALIQGADALANYGTAISGVNCSVQARLFLRVGLQQRHLPDVTHLWKEMPTIWQYARNANLKTILIDTWNRFGTFHSYMNTAEARQIDEFITLLDFPYYARDPSAADKLVKILQRNEPMFVYVNKYGTHMPYSDNFPQDLSYDPSSLSATLPLNQPRREAVRDYHKAIRWSVDGFFERVLPAIGGDTVLIYTSDHGQAMFEGGYDIGHCSADPHPGEVYVPLFAVTRSFELHARLQTEAKRAYNRASHFEIFPTLLELMGYSRIWVEKNYGPSLLRVPVDQQPRFFPVAFTSSSANWVSVTAPTVQPRPFRGK
jgi:lipid A ethanolaminephosphotransferase